MDSNFNRILEFADLSTPVWANAVFQTIRNPNVSREDVVSKLEKHVSVLADDATTSFPKPDRPSVTTERKRNINKMCRDIQDEIEKLRDQYPGDNSINQMIAIVVALQSVLLGL